MNTRCKIKIIDNTLLRTEIVELFSLADKTVLSKWAIEIAKHILSLSDVDFNIMSVVNDGFDVVTMWQSGEVSVHAVRQSALAVHKLARENSDEVLKNTLRVVGQAISTAHMKEHSIIASDYAIKVVGLMTYHNMKSITKEREWQLNCLKELGCFLQKQTL